MKNYFVVITFLILSSCITTQVKMTYKFNCDQKDLVETLNKIEADDTFRIKRVYKGHEFQCNKIQYYNYIIYRKKIAIYDLYGKKIAFTKKYNEISQSFYVSYEKKTCRLNFIVPLTGTFVPNTKKRRDHINKYYLSPLMSRINKKPEESITYISQKGFPSYGQLKKYCENND